MTGYPSCSSHFVAQGKLLRKLTIRRVYRCLVLLLAGVDSATPAVVVVTTVGAGSLHTHNTPWVGVKCFTGACSTSQRVEYCLVHIAAFVVDAEHSDHHLLRLLLDSRQLQVQVVQANNVSRNSTTRSVSVRTQTVLSNRRKTNTV